ncbi:D-glycero-alpha-D-manno-heptose-1,7-bisphosphate 7-phosphatase [Maricaulis sp. D1M11]|uniref:D-glycero-alpha-D-manno-heptose-1,7-bisphosphate 7-phosphatase n=1 Tax=Maricaulis sp. D1M11 TaxID=3076117 RepID=UPI0039B525A6
MTDPFLVLLDRDGTINIDKHYLSDPDGVEILPGAISGLLRLQAAGAVLAIVTNQSGVGRGYFDLETAWAVNKRVVELLAQHGVTIAHSAMCPHAPEEACTCRKPAPELALECARATGLALTSSWTIGDKASDVQLGRGVGGKGLLIAASPAQDFGQSASCTDLDAAADFILQERGL